MTDQFSNSGYIPNSRERLRCLVVSASDATREELQAALDQIQLNYQLFWVSEPELTLHRSADILPQIIFVDDALQGTPMSVLVEQLTRKVPTAATVALVDPANIAEARDAVLVGARSFLLKPISATDLENTLQQIFRRNPAVPSGAESEMALQGQIIAFCAPKGGTGRTTLAINTAISIHQLTGDGVVLVDADYAAPALDVALNLQREKDITTLLPRLSQLDEEMINSVLAHHASGISVLLAPPPEALQTRIPLPKVQQVMARLKRMFSWIVVDLGLPMDETAYAFLDGADRIVMSVLPEMVGLRNTRLMLDQLIAHGYSQDKIWLVLNRATMKGGISRQDIEQHLRINIREQIPDDQPLATFSINRGVPIVVSHPRSALANAYRTLSGHLLEEMSPAGAVEATKAKSNGNLLHRVFLKRKQTYAG